MHKDNEGKRASGLLAFGTLAIDVEFEQSVRDLSRTVLELRLMPSAEQAQLRFFAAIRRAKNLLQRKILPRYGTEYPRTTRLALVTYALAGSEICRNQPLGSIADLVENYVAEIVAVSEPAT
jgi:hypothetical protein